jgi:5-methylthioadenosine/S-adenosylhomocysteine deaminase
MYRRWHGKANGRLYAWCGPNSTWTGSDEAIKRYAEWALEKGTKIPIHVCETQRRLDDFRRLTGKTPAEHLYALNPELGKTIIAIHAVALTDSDIDLFAREGVPISHNTTSNCYIGDGLARVPEMLQKGITVSLGVDGPASNCSQNLWEMLKLTALVHKVSTRNSAIISAEQVLEMATIGGAKALGLEHEIGSIEVGKKADIILVDLSGINYTPLNRVVSQLVYCGVSTDVTTVLINGVPVLDNHQITTIDEDDLKVKTQQVTEDLVSRAGMEETRSILWKHS